MNYTVPIAHPKRTTIIGKNISQKSPLLSSIKYCTLFINNALK